MVIHRQIKKLDDASPIEYWPVLDDFQPKKHRVAVLALGLESVLVYRLRFGVTVSLEVSKTLFFFIT